MIKSPVIQRTWFNPNNPHKCWKLCDVEYFDTHTQMGFGRMILSVILLQSWTVLCIRWQHCSNFQVWLIDFFLLSRNDVANFVLLYSYSYMILWYIISPWEKSSFLVFRWGVRQSCLNTEYRGKIATVLVIFVKLIQTSVTWEEGMPVGEFSPSGWHVRYIFLFIHFFIFIIIYYNISPFPFLSSKPFLIPLPTLLQTHGLLFLSIVIVHISFSYC